jgi:hypothetical protein
MEEAHHDFTGSPCKHPILKCCMKYECNATLMLPATIVLLKSTTFNAS